MQLHQEQPVGVKLITGHGPGWLSINGERHTTALMLGNDFVRVLDDLPPDLADLPATLLAQVIAAAPAVVLFGAGANFALAPQVLVARLAAAGIGAESMDTIAAARTFNVLVAEARHVVAILLPPG